MGVSILILTLNEEQNLGGCLESVSWSDDVVVLDSYSTDQSTAIAQAAGARVLQRQFENYSAHRNWACREIEYKNRWVFSLDADERMTTELRDELLALERSGTLNEYAAFRVRYKNMFWGKWIKRSTLYPSWIIRFYRPECIAYEERIVNAHPIVDGLLGSLTHHFEHYSFNKGLAHWVEKHNSYSTMEAIESLRSIGSVPMDWRGLCSNDPLRRRRALKNFSIHLPCRPLVKFLYMYLLHRGFLDGFQGLTYCTLQAVYEYMIELKVKELRRREQGLPM